MLSVAPKEILPLGPELLDMAVAGVTG